MIVGLTGGIGSGKSEVSRRFQALGVDIVDADEVARAVVKPGAAALMAIAEHFGDELITAAGDLDRPKLRNIIFQDPNAKVWLENLLHPLIREQIVQQLQQRKSPYAILVSPLLLETTQHQLVDRVLVVEASEETQLARASARDNNNPEQIKAIMKTQLTREQRRAKADDIIYNDGNLAELDQQVTRLHSTYLALA